MSADVIQGNVIFAIAEPVIDNPNARALYFTKYSLTATAPELYTNPNPTPEN